MLTPTFFKTNSDKFYLSTITETLNSEIDIVFFEFFIEDVDPYSPDKVLVFVEPTNKIGPRTWKWFIFMKDYGTKIDYSYHYGSMISPEKDFFSFAKYVSNKTPDAISYILFNYIC